MPKNWGCHENYKSVKLSPTDSHSHRKSNGYISHLNYVQLYETLHLEMTAHFQKVTETGPSLKQVLLRYTFCFNLYRKGSEEHLHQSYWGVYPQICPVNQVRPKIVSGNPGNIEFLKKDWNTSNLRYML